MSWDTAANIINDAAVELGLYATDVADPYASTDANVLQLCRLLKAVGQDLLRDFAWTHFQKEHTFATVAGTAAYALPADFGRMLHQTHWNRTGVMPLQGPLGAQGWQLLKAQSATGAVGLWFRVVNNEVELQPVPTSAQTLAYEYVSRYWVQPSGQTAPTAEAPTDGADTLWLDRRLLVCALILKFKRAKGFDSAAAQEDYERALARAQGADGAAPVLSVSPRGLGVERLVDGCNVPERGFGS